MAVLSGGVTEAFLALPGQTVAGRCGELFASLYDHTMAVEVLPAVLAIVNMLTPRRDVYTIEDLQVCLPAVLRLLLGVLPGGAAVTAAARCAMALHAGQRPILD
jgi:hypothetical protein